MTRNSQKKTTAKTTAETMNSNMNTSKISKMKKINEKAGAVAKAYLSSEMLKTDPMGSYTGKPLDKNTKPVQDADDL